MTFWQLLNFLQHLQETCVVTPSGWTFPQYAPTVYGGSCLESFLIALKSHGADAWYYLTWTLP